MTCSYPNILSFKELCEFVEMECLPYYLDGPNLVDWIFPNAISANRNRSFMSILFRTLPKSPVTPSGESRPLHSLE